MGLANQLLTLLESDPKPLGNMIRNAIYVGVTGSDSKSTVSISIAGSEVCKIQIEDGKGKVEEGSGVSGFVSWFNKLGSKKEK